MNLKLDSFKKAVTTLKDAIELYNNNQGEQKLVLALRDSVIQRFEYTYEMAWKLIQRWISNNINPESSNPVYSRKELFRLAAKSKLIGNPNSWFKYHEARNVSAHTYDESNAEKAFEAGLEIVEDAEYLTAQLEKYSD